MIGVSKGRVGVNVGVARQMMEKWVAIYNHPLSLGGFQTMVVGMRKSLLLSLSRFQYVKVPFFAVGPCLFIGASGSFSGKVSTGLTRHLWNLLNFGEANFGVPM